MRKKHHNRLFYPSSFAAGLVTGFLFFLACASLIAVYIIQQGITIYFDSGNLAEIIRGRVAEQARADLPGVIAEAKAKIPAAVAKEMEISLQSDRMEIAGFVFRMPDELMRELRQMLQTNVENATEDILNSIDTALLAERFGEDAYRLVRGAVEEKLAGETFTVMIFHRFPLQVQIRMQEEKLETDTQRTGTEQAN